MNIRERAAQVLDDLKSEARGPADTPEPGDEELVRRASECLKRLAEADVVTLVQTYPAFRVLVAALDRYHAGHNAVDHEAAATQVGADLVANPGGREAAAVLWLCRMLRTPSRRATLDEIERWVDCLCAMPLPDALAFVKDHAGLRGPVLEAAIRRMRSRIYDPALAPAVRADAAELLVRLGINPASPTRH